MNTINHDTWWKQEHHATHSISFFRKPCETVEELRLQNSKIYNHQSSVNYRRNLGSKFAGQASHPLNTCTLLQGGERRAPLGSRWEANYSSLCQQVESWTTLSLGGGGGSEFIVFIGTRGPIYWAECSAATNIQVWQCSPIVLVQWSNMLIH